MASFVYEAWSSTLVRCFSTWSKMCHNYKHPAEMTLISESHWKFLHNTKQGYMHTHSRRQKDERVVISGTGAELLAPSGILLDRRDQLRTERNTLHGQRGAIRGEKLSNVSCRVFSTRNFLSYLPKAHSFSVSPFLLHSIQPPSPQSIFTLRYLSFTCLSQTETGREGGWIMSGRGNFSPLRHITEQRDKRQDYVN